MKVLESALLLVAGTALFTFAALSLGLFPRPLAFDNPTLLVEALAIAGLVVCGLGGRGLYRAYCALAGSMPTASCSV